MSTDRSGLSQNTFMITVELTSAPIIRNDNDDWLVYEIFLSIRIIINYVKSVK